MSLADVLAEPLSNGRSVPTREGGFPVLRLNALTDGRVDCSAQKEGDWGEAQAKPFLIRAGDFLLARGNGSLDLVGRAGLVAAVGEVPKVAFPDTMIRVRLDPTLIDQDFFRHLWASPGVRGQVRRLARTTAGIYKVNQAGLRSVHFVLPSLAEQRRLAAALDPALEVTNAADTSIARQRARVTALRESILRRASLGQLVPQELGDPAPVGLAELLGDGARGSVADLPELPAGWTWATLGELADVAGGVTKDNKNQTVSGLVEVPYLRVANVQRNQLRLDEVSRIKVTPDKLEALRLQPGDVLMNEGGDRDKLGRGWVWEGQLEDCIHQNHVFRARLRAEVLHPKLLSWHGNTFGQRWFESVGKQTTNLASLSLTNLRRLPVPVPPAAEQLRIVAELERHLSILDAVDAGLLRIAAQCDALRTAFLHLAFPSEPSGSESTAEQTPEPLRGVQAVRKPEPSTDKRDRRGTVRQRRAAVAAAVSQETA